jgi:nitroreductase
MTVSGDGFDPQPVAAERDEAYFVPCIAAAVAAPSLHNSQPWRFRIRDGGVDVYADRRRNLAVLDPSGRELMISVGAAVFNLRVAIRHQGRVPELRLRPDETRPDLAARVTAGPTAGPDAVVDALAGAIPRRHTNRRPFAPAVVPAAVLDELTAAAHLEGASLHVADPVRRNAILSLTETAERRLRAHGAYRAELAQWTTPHRRDGIPPRSFGPPDARGALPLRDFGLAQPIRHQESERFEPYPTILVICTEGDSAEQWLRAGQALQRVLLTATIHHLAASPISQPLEIPELRASLTDTGTGRWPQLILRLGYGQPAATTPRRPLADVLVT